MNGNKATLLQTNTDYMNIESVKCDNWLYGRDRAGGKVGI